MTKAIDWVVNIALLIAVMYAFTARGVASPTSAQLPPYIQGEVVPALPGADYAAVDQTVVLFLRSSCIYCEQSLPFYRRLVEARELRRASIRLVGITLENKEILDAFLVKGSVKLDATASVDVGDWKKLAKTPTVIVVDREGRVVKSWVGLLAPPLENEVLQQLKLRTGLWTLFN